MKSQIGYCATNWGELYVCHFGTTPGEVRVSVSFMYRGTREERWRQAKKDGWRVQKIRVEAVPK